MDELEDRVAAYAERRAASGPSLDAVVRRARRRRTRRRGTIAASVLVVVGAVGVAVNAAGSEDARIDTIAPSPTTEVATTPAPATSVAPATSAPTSVAPTSMTAGSSTSLAIGPEISSDSAASLPTDGVALQIDPDTVVLVGLDGTVFGHLKGVQLAYQYHELGGGPVGLLGDTALATAQLTSVGDLASTRMPLAGGALLVVQQRLGSSRDARIEHASGSITVLPEGEIRVSADRRWVTLWSPDGAEAWSSTDGTGPLPGQLADGLVNPVVLDDQSILRRTDAGLEPLAGGGPTPPPSGLLGSWRAADEQGDWILAQWSGECESPSAFFIPRSGGDPVEIAPGAESYALGWTADGRAVVHFPVGHCGDTHEEAPGIYLFDPTTGALELVYASAADTSLTAKMWSPLEG